MQPLCVGTVFFLAYLGASWGLCDKVDTTAWQPSVCAKVYEHEDCEGSQMDIMTDSNMHHRLDDFNDKTSSLAVRRKCVLTVYDHTGFGGCRYKFGHVNGHYTQMPYVYDVICGGSWNDAVSSVRCTCNTGGGSINIHLFKKDPDT